MKTEAIEITKVNNKTRRDMKTTWLMMRGVLATMWGMGLCQGQSLTVNLANNPIQLEPNLAGQKVVIMGMNGTGGPVEVAGGYLTF